MPDRYGDIPEPETESDRKRRLYEAGMMAARAIQACHLCNDDGYIGGQVCDHIDHAETAKRGMAMVRATMGWKS